MLISVEPSVTIMLLTNQRDEELRPAWSPDVDLLAAGLEVLRPAGDAARV